MKVVSVYPGNAARGKPSVVGTYLLMAAATGEPLAVIDGQALTLWRTAAASALAASYLAREDASRLVMVGAGALAPYLIEAHASDPAASTDVLIWNRNAGARRGAGRATLRAGPTRCASTTDLEAAVRAADIDLLRHAQFRAAGARRLAEARARISTWSAPSRRRCAKATTKRSRGRASMSTRARAR